MLARNRIPNPQASACLGILAATTGMIARKMLGLKGRRACAASPHAGRTPLEGSSRRSQELAVEVLG